MILTKKGYYDSKSAFQIKHVWIKQILAFELLMKIYDIFNVIKIYNLKLIIFITFRRENFIFVL